MPNENNEQQNPPAPAAPDPAATLSGKLIARPGVWARCTSDAGTAVRFADLEK